MRHASPLRSSHFYPRPLRGGRPAMSVPPYTSTVFLSTPSARRATSRRYRCCRSRPISIHALCEEGDGFVFFHGAAPFNFYPRPLRGGRQLLRQTLLSFSVFLSTPSARRATTYKHVRAAATIISIHALCEEGDSRRCTSRSYRFSFLSTPSARRATSRPLPPRNDHPISIHALCEEGDSPAPLPDSTSLYFYPRPLRGGRPTSQVSDIFSNLFLSTPSARRATRRP